MSLITASWSRFAAPERRTMGVACGAHVLHDGYTDLLYVLLPIWQAQFGLGYAEVGILRALFTGSLGSLQVPARVPAGRAGCWASGSAARSCSVSARRWSAPDFCWPALAPDMQCWP